MPTPNTLRLTRDQTQLVVVDMQEKMLPHITQQADVRRECVRMIRAAVEMDLPITISEQYVRGLGPTNPDVLEAASQATNVETIEKMTFSLCRHDALRDRIQSLGRPQVLLVGVETHVCVAQTALDLLDMSLQPIILADAVGSRRPTDRDTALARLRSASAIITTVEAAIFELLEIAGTDVFKRILPLVR
ncbi:MAG: isochorismatase family protein [Planctomycetota bacterium]